MALNKAITKISDKMTNEYNSSFVVKEASFKGLSGIEMKGISLTPKNADTLLRVNEIKTSINIARLLTGDIQLGTLEMQNGFIQLVKNANGKNFDAFLRKKDKEELTDDNEGTDYASRAYKLLHRALNLVPTDMRLKNLTLRLDDMGRKVTLNLMNLKLEDKQLESTIGVSAKDITQNWKVKGFADPRNKQANLDFFNTDTTRIEIPYLNERYGLKSGFDSIHVNVDDY